MPLHAKRYPVGEIHYILTAGILSFAPYLSCSGTFRAAHCVVVGGRRRDNYQLRNEHKNMI